MTEPTRYPLNTLQHGHNRRGQRSGTYTSWSSMRTRVTNPNRAQAKDYIGRGIDMDPRWNDFSIFLADMGERPAGMTIEREDNDKGYWPTNCRWATSRDQARNSRHRVAVELHGRSMLIVDALAAMGRTWKDWRRVRKRYATAQEAIDFLGASTA